MAQGRGLRIAAAALAALTIGGGVLARVTGHFGDVREIRLVVRDMTYFLEGSDAANPTLQLKRGERIRLVLTNHDEGYAHNLVAPLLGVSMPLRREGSQSVEITVPNRAGVSRYACGPHAGMMSGIIAIE